MAKQSLDFVGQSTQEVSCWPFAFSAGTKNEKTKRVNMCKLQHPGIEPGTTN